MCPSGVRFWKYHEERCEMLCGLRTSGKRHRKLSHFVKDQWHLLLFWCPLCLRRLFFIGWGKWQWQKTDIINRHLPSPPALATMCCWVFEGGAQHRRGRYAFHVNKKSMSRLSHVFLFSQPHYSTRYHDIVLGYYWVGRFCVTYKDPPSFFLNRTFWKLTGHTFEVTLSPHFHGWF